MIVGVSNYRGCVLLFLTNRFSIHPFFFSDVDLCSIQGVSHVKLTSNFKPILIFFPFYSRKWNDKYFLNIHFQQSYFAKIDFTWVKNATFYPSTTPIFVSYVGLAVSQVNGTVGEAFLNRKRWQCKVRMLFPFLLFHMSTQKFRRLLGIFCRTSA